MDFFRETVHGYLNSWKYRIYVKLQFNEKEDNKKEEKYTDSKQTSNSLTHSDSD